MTCCGTRILQIRTVFLYLTFISKCFWSRFLLSSPLFRPGAERGPREALAPGHGQTSSWPNGVLAPWRLGARSFCRHGALVVVTLWRWKRREINGSLSGAGRYPKQAGRKEVARQSQPGMHHASTWLSAFVRLPHLQARPRLLVV